MYNISLYGKGYGKGDDVISSIQGKLSSFKKDEDRSKESHYVYTDDKTEIELYEKRGNIIIAIRSVISQ